MLAAIPWTAVHQYGIHKRLEPDVLDLLWFIVRRMDAIERLWRAENPPPKRPGGTGG